MMISLKKESFSTFIYFFLGLFCFSFGASYADNETEILKKLPNLIKNLTNKDTLKRREAIKELSQIGPKVQEVLPAFIIALRDTDEVIRKEAADALAVMGSEAVPELIKILSKKKFVLRGR